MKHLTCARPSAVLTTVLIALTALRASRPSGFASRQVLGFASQAEVFVGRIRQVSSLLTSSQRGASNAKLDNSFRPDASP